MNRIKFKILVLLFLANGLSAQLRTNLEMLNALVDSSAKIIAVNLNIQDSKFKIDFRTPDEYSSLNSRLINALSRSGLKISNIDGANTISYSINNARVEYPDLFKDGILGSFLIERKIYLNGEFEINNSTSIIKGNTFNITATDTIQYEKLNFAENSSLPFTKGKVPPEPFFPSLLEPVIAITTVVVTVLLFFSVRSK